ncbi:VMAP-C domain-containing protein [Streptomyces sp. YKOK-I1]
MAGLRDADDPARVHAVVVGIERYPRHSGWDLPGAVDDALRFHRWLRKGGVPEANVQLLLAPGEDSRVRLDALAGELTWRQTWTRDQLMDAFTEGLDRRTGDLLYVFWGSHGVLGQGDRRLLLCPDASPKDKRCLDTANLMEYLQRDDLTGFGQQVLLFDSCATFLEHHNQSTGPAVAGFPTVRRRRVEQFAVCAAAPGQVAENDPALRSGVFSKAMLDWLETHATAGPSPDLAALVAHVRAETPETQTPVSIEVRALDGSREQLLWPGRAPLPPSTDRSRLALALHDALGDADLRARCVEHLAVQCPDAALGACPSDERIAHVLLTVERAMAALVEVVHTRNRQAADQLLALGRTHGMPGLLSPLEHRSLRELFGRTPQLPPTARVIAAVRAAQPLAKAWLPPPAAEETDGPSVDQLMACVEHFEELTGGQSVAHPGRQLVPAVVRFTELLAALVPALRRELQDWADRVAHRLGVDGGALAERRAEALSWPDSLGPAAGRPRVLAQLDAAPLGSADDEDDRYTCVMWVDTGAGDLVQAAEQSIEPLSSRGVVRRIKRTVKLLRAETEEIPVVEILLQPDAVQLPVDAWNGADDGDALPYLLGVEWATALRCAPLADAEREEQRQEGLRNRRAGRYNDTVVFLDDGHAKGYAGYGALMADVRAARAVVRAGPDGRDRLVQAALRLGYPVVLWDRQAPAQVPDVHFDALRPERAVDGLPWRIRDYRAQACMNPAAHPACPAALLESADRPLPPVLSLTGLSDPAARSDPPEANP